jgi:predicted DNA-binding transcriptional regulator AlpA
VAAYPPVVAMAELAAVLGISRTRLVQLMRGPGFPEPVATLTVGRIWSTRDIEAYARRTGRVLHPLARV